MSEQVGGGGEHLDVLIVGAGFSGIGTGIKLDQAGIGDWLMLEMGDGVGGTWHWNTYPGVAVDIPSFSYQFSFEPRTDWPRVYAPGRELKAYAEHCVDTYGLRSRIRLNTKVAEAAFDEEHRLWRFTLADGSTLSARYLVGATAVEVTREANQRYFETAWRSARFDPGDYRFTQLDRAAQAAAVLAS